MADIRALMAQERQARRVNHEFASYSKSSVLTCTVCQLNIKSETLWDGHLRSANHKNNVKRLHEVTRIVAKRKIEDVEETEDAGDADARKKLRPKGRTPSQTTGEQPQSILNVEDEVEDGPIEAPPVETNDEAVKPPVVPTTAIEVTSSVPVCQPTAKVDEDEWAAFERDVAALAQPDYSEATITAAPVSAAQLEAEAESDRKKLRDTEADDEKEDEGRRMEEEFEIMEEMEERVKKLKEKREALRSTSQKEVNTGRSDDILENLASKDEVTNSIDHSDDDDDDDVDDWYS